MLRSNRIRPRFRCDGYIHRRSIGHRQSSRGKSLSSFFFRLVIPVDEAEAFASITETIAEGEVSKGVVPVILDIDVFRMGAFPIVAERLWPSFEQLRELKNRFFFRSLTDKAKELFK